MATSDVDVLGGTVTAPGSSYSVLLTTEPAMVRAAQRLRHDVFCGELGVTLHSSHPGHDVDRFDAHCDHLVVCDRDGAPVGTYRLLPPERVAAAGGLYADGEFDLTALDPLRPQLVETGRSCVHPDHRNGAVIGLMWAGLARYLLLTGHRWLGGCASVPLSDGGAAAARVGDHVRARHLAPEAYRVRPLRPWDAAGTARAAGGALPPLLRGYLRLGAQVCGEPAYDPEFDSADFFLLLDAHRLDDRYVRHFLGPTA